MTELTDEEKQSLSDLRSRVESGQRNESGISPEMRAKAVDLVKRVVEAGREIIEERHWDKKPGIGNFAHELSHLGRLAELLKQGSNPIVLKNHLPPRRLCGIDFDTGLADDVIRLHPELYEKPIPPIGDPEYYSYLNLWKQTVDKLKSEIITSFAKKVGFLKPDESITTALDKIRIHGVPDADNLVKGSIDHGFIEIPHPDPNKPFVLFIGLFGLPINYKDRRDYTLGKDFFAKGYVAVEWDESRMIKVEE